jgi:hypothetical protein
MIYIIRGQKVMLDSDLAKLYGVETKVMNQAVRRNLNRFPDDFMFQLDQDYTQKEDSIHMSSVKMVLPCFLVFFQVNAPLKSIFQSCEHLLNFEAFSLWRVQSMNEWESWKLNPPSFLK